MTSLPPRFRFLALLPGALVLSACRTDVTPPDGLDRLSPGQAIIRTDSIRYTLRTAPGAYEAWANVTLANRGPSPLVFARCHPESSTPMWGVRRTGPDSTARATIGGAWACVGGVPTGQLAPGDSMTLRVWLGSALSPNANPPILPAERVGRFRIELTLCRSPVADSDRCEWLPQHQRQSDAFDVVFP